MRNGLPSGRRSRPHRGMRDGVLVGAGGHVRPIVSAAVRARRQPHQERAISARRQPGPPGRTSRDGSTGATTNRSPSSRAPVSMKKRRTLALPERTPTRRGTRSRPMPTASIRPRYRPVSSYASRSQRWSIASGSTISTLAANASTKAQRNPWRKVSTASPFDGTPTTPAPTPCRRRAARRRPRTPSRRPGRFVHRPA